jgi:hypothetical protein
MEQTSSRGMIIKNIYLHLVSFVALMMIVISTATIINDVLKTYVFIGADRYFDTYAPGCDGSAVVPGGVITPSGKPTVPPESAPISVDQCAQQKEMNRKMQEQNRKANFEQSMVWSISMLVVAIPLFSYHWYLIRKKEKREV